MRRNRIRRRRVRHQGRFGRPQAGNDRARRSTAASSAALTAPPRLVLAEAPPSISRVHEARRRGDPGSSAGPIAAQPHEESLDDWLGDISDDDWSEKATEIAERRRATPAYQELSVPEEVWRDPTADLLTGPGAAAEAHRAIVQRRRLVAGLVVVMVLAFAVVIPVLLLRGQDRPPETPVPEAETTGAAPTPTETSPSSTPTTATTPSTTPPSSTPSKSGAPSFTLPEGTKLQRGTGDPTVTTGLEAITDPEVVTELQRALSSAGYDPGPADGKFGPRTETAVIAFQQANGLSADGVVGPETASALNGVVAGG